ncbi:MAG: 5'-3' exonuclease [Microgenomates group bacterium]
MERLVLIDGHALLHRAYHAFPLTLRTRKGEIVNAVYGFTRILLTVLKDLKPKYLAVAFDRPEPTFRHQEYVGYQVQRPTTEKEFKEQIVRVKEVVRAFNIPIFEKPGYEADDVIASLIFQAQKKFQKSNSDFQIIIVSGDKDLMQLVEDKVFLYLPQKGFTEAKLCGEKEVEEILGIKPSQVVDYKALVGDASDNYPGVPGIGPKTAINLLQQFGSLKGIYKNLKKISPKVAQKLKDGKESAELSQKLAKIITNVPIKLSLKACRFGNYDEQKVIALFKGLEFRSLINKLPSKEEEKVKEKDEQMTLF